MEVEIKARVEEPQKIESLLLDMGAEYIGMVEEEDIYFAHPSRDFARTDEALRIRNNRVLTYKGPKVDLDTKSREEIEVYVSDGRGMIEILKKLGFKPVQKVYKVRKNYRLGEVLVSLDYLPELGNFVEVECIGEYQDSRGKVIHVASQLGLKDFIRESYLEMLMKNRIK